MAANAPNEKYKPAQVAAALTETKGMVTLAARKLKCSAATVYRYLKLYPEVEEAQREATEALGDNVELTLMNAALGQRDPKTGAILREPNIAALIFLAKTKFKARGYTERTEVLNFNVDPALVNKVMELAESKGISAGELFNDLIAELSAAGDPK